MKKEQCAPVEVNGVTSRILSIFIHRLKMKNMHQEAIHHPVGQTIGIYAVVVLHSVLVHFSRAVAERAKNEL